MIAFLVSLSFLHEDTYYNFDGDRFASYRLDVGPWHLFFQDERYEFGEWFTSSYQVHFMSFYTLDRLLSSWMGDMALPGTVGASIGWELVEERVIRVCPISLMDIAWGAMGAFLADAHRRGDMKNWGFSCAWFPADIGEDYMSEVTGTGALASMAWSLIPGNYNPYTFSVHHGTGGHWIEAGFQYTPRFQSLPTERPPTGWAMMSWDTQRGLGFTTSDLLATFPEGMEEHYDPGPHQPVAINETIPPRLVPFFRFRMFLP